MLQNSGAARVQNACDDNHYLLQELHVSEIFLTLDSCISQTLKIPRGSREVAVRPSPLIPTVRFPHLIKNVIQDFSSKLQQPCT